MPPYIFPLERQRSPVLYAVLCILLIACLSCVSSAARSNLNCNVRWYLQHEAQKDGCRKQTIGTHACFGRCDTYQVPILEPPYKTSNHDMCSYGQTELKTIELDDCDFGVNRTYVYVNALSCQCRNCRTENTFCLGVH